MIWLGSVFWTLGDFLEHHIGAITAVIAIAAIMQWRETRRTAERQLRAYVLNSTATIIDGTNLDPKPFLDRTGQPGMMIEIKNFGQTPAFQLIHWSEMEVSPTAREAAIKPPASLGKIHPNVIGPGHTNSKSRWLERSLSVQEIAGIQNGTYGIYIYGRIEYVDAFGEPRWSNYKLVYTNAAWPPIGNPRLTFCGDGNDAT